MQKKLFFIIILISKFGFTQNVYTEDHINLGDRSIFINSCVDGFEKETIDLNGINVNKHKYCSCVCDKVIPLIKSEELFEAVKKNDIVSLLLNEPHLTKLLNCVEGNMSIDEDYVFKSNKYNEKTLDISIKTCMNEILQNPDDYQWTQSEAKEYCDCAINNLYSKGYTYKDLLEVTDENSVAFNEIVIPCMSNILNDESSSLDVSENIYNPADIKGNSLYSKIKLINYSNSYKIKIEIGGVVKYFLFDTGAADLVIDRDFERELLINGVINKDSYIGKSQYILANNEEVKADIIKVNNLKIGDYILSNTYIAVIDEGGMLCGISLLNKFKKWNIDTPKNELILYR